jgi:Rieske Fe-S protein
MKTISRRQFLKNSAMTVVVTSTCMCSFSSCATLTKIGDTPAIAPEALSQKGKALVIDLSKEPILSQVGGAVKIKNKDIPSGIIIAHSQEKQFKIVSLLCTHRGVEVEYDHKKQWFKCASLGSSTFTLEGQNKGGLAKKPLQTYEATLNGSRLTITI